MIKCSVSMSPHVQQGKATGYYMLVQHLFVKPVHLARKQMFGFCGGLVVTAGGIEHLGWNSVMHMAVKLPLLNGEPVNWLSTAGLYDSSGGFRVYVPGKILKPSSAEEGVTRLWGQFESCPVGDTTLYFLRLPQIDGDVLLGRRKLNDIGKRD